MSSKLYEAVLLLAYEAEATPPEACIGDCSGKQTVAVNDIITLLNIALGNADASVCLHGIPAGTSVDVSLIVRAVNNALNGGDG